MIQVLFIIEAGEIQFQSGSIRMFILEIYLCFQAFTAQQIGDLKEIVFNQFLPEVFFGIFVHDSVELVPIKTIKFSKSTTLTAIIRIVKTLKEGKTVKNTLSKRYKTPFWEVD